MWHSSGTKGPHWHRWQGGQRPQRYAANRRRLEGVPRRAADRMRRPRQHLAHGGGLLAPGTQGLRPAVAASHDGPAGVAGNKEPKCHERQSPVPLVAMQQPHRGRSRTAVSAFTSRHQQQGSSPAATLELQPLFTFPVDSSLRGKPPRKLRFRWWRSSDLFG